jgi:hypothetical protein
MNIIDRMRRGDHYRWLETVVFGEARLREHQPSGKAQFRVVLTM